MGKSALLCCCYWNCIWNENMRCKICKLSFSLSIRNPMPVKWSAYFRNKSGINANICNVSRWMKHTCRERESWLKKGVNSWNAIFMFDANLLIVFSVWWWNPFDVFELIFSCDEKYGFKSEIKWKQSKSMHIQWDTHFQMQMFSSWG